MESGSVRVELDSVKLNIAFPPIAFFVILIVGWDGQISTTEFPEMFPSPTITPPQLFIVPELMMVSELVMMPTAKLLMIPSLLISLLVTQ